MTRVTRALAGAVAALALVACGVRSQDEPVVLETPVPTPTATPTAQETSSSPPPTPVGPPGGPASTTR